MKLRVCVAGFGLWLCTAATSWSQALSGVWQGTLSGHRTLRLRMDMTPAEKGWKATLYVLDQGGRLPVSSVAEQGADITFELTGIGVTYRAKLDANGTTLSGIWDQQGRGSFPLTLQHVSGDQIWPIPAKSIALTPMPADAQPSFEVATIRPSRPGVEARGYRLQGRDFSMQNATLGEMICFAYDLHDSQILHAPDWVRTKRFDVMGQQDLEGLPSTQQLKNMMQKLLVDRFQLKFHHEQKMLTVYELRVAQGGPKMTRDEVDSTGIMGMGFAAPGDLHIHNGSMKDFSLLTLQGIILDRPVVDKTNLSGRYDFELHWTPDGNQFAGKAASQSSDDPSDAPDLRHALERQLGSCWN